MDQGHSNTEEEFPLEAQLAIAMFCSATREAWRRFLRIDPQWVTVVAATDRGPLVMSIPLTEGKRSVDVSEIVDLLTDLDRSELKRTAEFNSVEVRDSLRRRTESN